MEKALPVLHVILALTLSPLLLGVINRTKAVFAGRRGQPLGQAYRDLAKLLRKGAVYSGTTTWVFRAGPVAAVASALVGLLFLPLGRIGGLMAFEGDLVLLAYLLGLGRFMTILAAFDTGSAFEGMGASREAQFSLLGEPALLAGMAILAACTGSASLSLIYARLPATPPYLLAPVVVLVTTALFIVMLAENSRLPVDDPNTHLELTMIHEVMVLDHGGPDLALIEYGSALKLWIFAALLSGLAVPFSTGSPAIDFAAALAAMCVVAVAVGTVESIMARLRLLRVPQMLTVGAALSIIAAFWVLGH